ELFTHETRTLRTLLGEGFKPSVVYDIGASNGVWSDTIALTLPDADYHLFEPLAESLAFYRRGLPERRARDPRVHLPPHALHLHPVALSDHNGTAKMFATHDGFGSSMLDRGDIPEVKEQVSVPRFKLDEFVERNSLLAPNVMKLDVQGAERLILSGGFRTMRK